MDTADDGRAAGTDGQPAGLAEDSKVEPEPEAKGWYRGTVHSRWSMIVPNGGYLAAIALRAVAAVVDGGTPRHMSASFFRAAKPGPVRIHAERLVDSGDGLQIAKATLYQRERPIVEVLVWVGAGRGGVEHQLSRAPDVLEPQELVSFDEIWPWGPGALPIRQNFDGAAVPGYYAEPRDTPDFICWAKYRPIPTFADPFVDAGRGLILADIYSGVAAMGPYQNLGVGFPITLYFQATFWQPTTSEWLLVESESPVASAGHLAATATIWDRDRQPVVTLNGGLAWVGPGLPSDLGAER